MMEFMASISRFLGTMVNLVRAGPHLICCYSMLIIRSAVSVFKYHLVSWQPAKPLHDEIAMIVGSDSNIGRAFSSQVVKMNGTVVCVDDSKMKGDAFVKGINENAGMTKAYFYECDLTKPDGMAEIIERVTKDVGDITIVLNCSTMNTVGLYYSVYKTILNIMKENNKGHLVFLRAYEPETRNAVQCLHDAITQELMLAANCKVSPTLAHIYPKMSSEGERNIFGVVKPEVIAAEVLDGVARKVPEIYLPGYMVYISFWLNFVPTSLVKMIENVLFGDYSPCGKF